MQTTIKSTLRWVGTGVAGLAVFAFVGVALVTAMLFGIGLWVALTL